MTAIGYAIRQYFKEIMPEQRAEIEAYEQGLEVGKIYGIVFMSLISGFLFILGYIIGKVY